MGHRYWFASPIVAPDLPVPGGSLPSGQLVSGAEDMSHYLIAHLNEGRYGDIQILSPAGIAELHSPAVEANMMGVPLIPNLSVALTLIIPGGGLGGLMLLFMPDFSWIALVCSSFALVWIFLRTGLILWTLRKLQLSKSLVQAVPQCEVR